MSGPGPNGALYARLANESALVALTASRAGNAALEAVLEQPVDWDAVVTLALRERALVQVVRRLERVRQPLVPPAVLSRMARMALVSEFQLSSLHDRLGKLLAVYAENDIDALLLKGAGLAYSAYESPVERPMGDIDLLVRPEVAERAWTLAIANGWARRKDVPEERSYEDHQHLSPLEDSDGLQIGLELHIALFTRQAPFVLPASQLWDGARGLTIGGTSAFVPSPEDQLLHAALHFAWSHEMTFGAWRTLRDVDRILATGAVDWPLVIAKAKAARGATCTYWTLRLARELAGVEVPEPVLEALSPRLPEAVRRRLTVHFAQQALPSDRSVAGSVSLSRALWTLAVRPRAEGHGSSRPWLDTEEWVRVPGGMRNTRTSAARRIIQHSFGLLRMVGSLMGS